MLGFDALGRLALGQLSPTRPLEIPASCGSYAVVGLDAGLLRDFEAWVPRPPDTSTWTAGPAHGDAWTPKPVPSETWTVEARQVET